MPRAVLFTITGLCCLGGFVLLNLPQSGTLAIIGVVLLTIALLIGIGAILRAGRGSITDREREASAREHFDRTGRWPGE